MIPIGRAFYKMSGSGNDFVVVDVRTEPPGSLAEPETVQRICARGTGVGADGIVFVGTSEVADVRLVYLNADGTPADLCGNATLCTTRLAVELGMASPAGFAIETDSGVVAARMNGGQPEIDLQPAVDIQPSVPGIGLGPGELRMGFAFVGVPHLVIQCGSVAAVDVVDRGRPLRNHASLAHGANVNFVARGADGRWQMRTYERGVEAETLACGSGSVAIGILLTAWGEADAVSGAVDLETKSGRDLRVALRRSGDRWLPSLCGEGRIVYQGRLSEILV